MRLSEEQARSLTGTEVTVDQVEQVKREMHILHDRAEKLEEANDELLQLANRAEHRAQEAEAKVAILTRTDAAQRREIELARKRAARLCDTIDQLRECEHRAYREAMDHLKKAANLALLALSASEEEVEERSEQIGEALCEIQIARALTVAMLPQTAVAIAQKAARLEAVLTHEMPCTVELADEGEVAA